VCYTATAAGVYELHVTVGELSSAATLARQMRNYVGGWCTSQSASSSWTCRQGGVHRGCRMEHTPANARASLTWQAACRMPNSQCAACRLSSAHAATNPDCPSLRLPSHPPQLLPQPRTSTLPSLPTRCASCRRALLPSAAQWRAAGAAQQWRAAQPSLLSKCATSLGTGRLSGTGSSAVRWCMTHAFTEHMCYAAWRHG